MSFFFQVMQDGNNLKKIKFFCYFVYFHLFLRDESRFLDHNNLSIGSGIKIKPAREKSGSQTS